MKVGIIEYKCGNVQSVENALIYLGHEVERVASPDQLHLFDVLILPGVGAFQPAMASLQDSGFLNPLNDIAKQGNTRIIGICLGMQLMCNVSFEHGEHQGIGWINAEVRPIREFTKDIKVPHIGWNDIHFTINNLGFDSSFEDKDYYFVHSYCVKANDDSQVIAETEYGTKFASIVANGNIIGIQFHPEKSQELGLKLLDQAIKQDIKSTQPLPLMEGYHA